MVSDIHYKIIRDTNALRNKNSYCKEAKQSIELQSEMITDYLKQQQLICCTAMTRMVWLRWKACILPMNRW